MYRKLLSLFLALIFAVIPIVPVNAAQTTVPADGYMGAGTRTTAEAQQMFEDVSSVIMELVGGRAEKSVVTLASDAFTPSVDYAVYPLQPESGTADNLATISTTSARDGSVILLRNNNSANTITVKHGTGNIFLTDGADYAINGTQDYLAVILRGSNWYELYRSDGNITKTLPGAKTETSATVASGMLPLTQAINKVAGEGSASDNLDGISNTFGGNLIVLRTADASDVITVRNNQAPNAGYYTILTLDGASVVLDSLTKYIILHKDIAGTAWREVARGGFISEAPAAANTALMGPTSGAAAVSTFRRPVLADLPSATTYPQQVRMTCTSGDLDAEGFGLTSTTVYVAPCGGNIVSLPDATGNNFTPISFSELSLSGGSDDFRIYDAFLYNNSGVVAVEKNAWDSAGITSGSITGVSAANPAVLTANNSLNAGDTIYIFGITGTVGTDSDRGLNKSIQKVASATGTTITLETGVSTSGLAYTSGGTFIKVPQARTDSLTRQNGLFLKTSDKTRLYIGTFVSGLLAAAGRVQDDVNARMLWNYFNRQTRKMYSTMQNAGGVTTHTYTTNTMRPFSNSWRSSTTGTRCYFCVGIEDDDHLLTVRQRIASSAAGGLAIVNLCRDSVLGGVAAQSLYAGATTSVASQEVDMSSAMSARAVIGCHFYQYTEKCSGGSTTTWTHTGQPDEAMWFVTGRY